MSNVVLSFHDSLLYDTDFSLLDKNQWLNDKVIGFVYEYFEREEFESACDEIAFVSPDVAQFIKLASEDDVVGFMEPLGLAGKQLVFFAVNDQSSAETTGGSHWSLLVYSKSVGEFHHYDSYGGSNFSAAQAMAHKISSAFPGLTSAKVISKTSPQQVNTCDCGMYVVCITEQLTRLYLKMDCTPLQDLITPKYVTQYRQKLQKLIKDLAKSNHVP